MKIMKSLKGFAFSAVALLAAGAAHAEIDVSAATDGFLADLTPAVAAIGGVLVSAAFLVLVWRWVLRMVGR